MRLLAFGVWTLTACFAGPQTSRASSAGDCQWDGFGTSACVLPGRKAGDGPRIVVGAPDDRSDGDTPRGSLFEIDWKSGEVRRVRRSTEPHDGFGSSVCLIDDLNGDGVPEIAVASPRASLNEKRFCGRVSVLSGRDFSSVREVWGERAEGRFGTAIRAASVPGSPEKSIVAVLREPTRESEVAVMAFDRNVDKHRWTATTTAAEGIWNRSLVALSDLDGDGFREFGIGAPHPSQAPEGAGHVDVLSGADGKRLFRARGAPSTAWFGTSICALTATEPGERFALAVGSLDWAGSEPGGGRIDIVGVPSGRLRQAAIGSRIGDGFGHRLAGAGPGAGAGVPLFVAAVEGPPGTPSSGGCVMGLSTGAKEPTVRLLGLQAHGRLGDFLSSEELPADPVVKLLLAGAPGAADTPSYWGMKSYSHLVVLFRESDAWRVRVFASDGEVTKEELGTYVRLETP